MVSFLLGRKAYTALCLAAATATTTTTTILVNGFSSSTNPHYRTRIPEQLVQYQLDALQKGDVAAAFEYNSENSQAMTGPWQSYAAALADTAFRPLLGHAESTVLMTICHGEYVCCLVKVVPGSDPLPKRLVKVIEETRRAEEEEEDDDDEEEEEEEEDEDTANKSQPACYLYWWEVSEQYDDEDETGDDFFYLVDSILPDAEDLEMDYMESTLFAIGDDEFDEDDDEDSFFFDLGLSM